MAHVRLGVRGGNREAALERLQRRALRLVREQYDPVERVALELLEHVTLDGERIHELVRG